MISSAPGPRLLNWISVFLFLSTIGLPLVGTLAGIEGGDEKAENRDLATFPSFDGTWRSAVEYGEGIDRWFSDHFAFRSRLVQWFGETRYLWLGVSPSPRVVAGKDSWLFYGEDFSIDDYANARPFSEFDEANWRESIVRARDWLAESGIAYVFTIAPDKHVIYADEFPESINRVGPMSRMDQLYAAISDTRVVVDLRPALSHARVSERLYHRTDTHWNDRGAFAAYQQIVEALRSQAPAVPPAWPRSDFDEVPSLTDGKDLAGMIGLTHVLREDDLTLVPRRRRLARIVEPIGRDPRAPADRVVTEIPGSSLPRAVIFRDSFAGALIPFLSEHFRRAVYVWQNDFDSNLIRAEHPDVVIQEIVGRHLYSFVPSPELVPK